MSLPRSLRCTFTASKIPIPLRTQPRRCLQTSRRLRQDDQESATNNVVPTSSGSTPRGVKKRATAAHFRAYTEEERERLKKKYTPEQFAAIEAGEAAIDPQDLANQGVIRTGPMTLDYLDDFSQISPVLDKPVRGPEHYDPNLRFKEEDELMRDLEHFAENLPDDADPVEAMKFSDNMRLMVGKEEAEKDPRSYTAPELPKISDPLVRSVARMSANANDDSEMTVFWERLSKQTGMPVGDMQKLRVKTLDQHGVVNQTRLGKVRSMYFITVAGNERGLLGIGEGKSSEPEDARRQSVLNAIRNMQPIPRYENRTIYGDVKGKVGATELELYNRPPGSSLSRPQISFIRQKVVVVADQCLSHRLWHSMSGQDIRNVQVRRHLGPGGQGDAVEESDEYDQGDDAGAAEAEDT